MRPRARVGRYGFSSQRSQSTSSERSCRCLRITKPAINRVGGGGWPEHTQSGKLEYLRTRKSQTRSGRWPFFTNDDGALLKNAIAGNGVLTDTFEIQVKTDTRRIR